MCATCGCGQKDKKHPKYGKGKDAVKKAVKKVAKPAFLDKKKDKK